MHYSFKTNYEVELLTEQQEMLQFATYNRISNDEQVTELFSSQTTEVHHALRKQTHIENQGQELISGDFVMEEPSCSIEFVKERKAKSDVQYCSSNDSQDVHSNISDYPDYAEEVAETGSSSDHEFEPDFNK